MFDLEKIRAKIECVAIDEMERSPEEAREVAFHMTDWLDDLHRYVKFCENPDESTPAAVNDMLLAFLIHVPNHMAAAAKLYAGFPVSDIFGVGAIATTDLSEG
ncbi:hypothetical protein LJR090_000484 [Bosea sp. LjRoot90]|uniref:hypothetical protein n=1 Tax=Bosea sp. LjRoot90 TaxID=3342342 RepID=UPI003ED0DB27